LLPPPLGAGEGAQDPQPGGSARESGEATPDSTSFHLGYGNSIARAPALMLRSVARSGGSFNYPGAADIG
jgi:hypothetical protein